MKAANNKSEELQVGAAILLGTIAEEGVDLFYSFDFSDDDKIIKAFEDHAFVI